MHLSAKMIMALLIGLALTTSDSSGSSNPTQGIPQQTATMPDTNGQETSSANPDASGIYHGGKGVWPPQIIYSVDPEFTDKARQKKLSGTCVVSVVVDRTGRPQDVHVVRSIAAYLPPKFHSAAIGLDENAVIAAKQYRFKPGTYKGKPVPVEVNIEITYSIY
jgi:TonB family protein